MIPTETYLIKLPEVMRRTGLSRSQTYALIKQAKFPKQISLTGERSSAWIVSEIQEWIQNRITASRQGN